MHFSLRSLLFLFSFLFVQKSFSQQSQDIEKITPAQFAMTSCSFDKEANAVVIFDRATSNYDDDYRLVTNRRIRIKILKENGIEKGNVSIPFYSKDQFERLSRIGGVSITPGENQDPEWTHLENKSIYTRKINDIYSEVTFALPNVKVGTIIEYWYESTMEHYGGLQDWYFQHDIPVMQSTYHLYVVPNAVFSYVVKKSRNLDVSIDKDPATGRISFEMRNVPGLNGESFSPSYRNYLQRIDFQLSAIVNRYGGVQKFTNTWSDLNRELLNDKNFGGSLKKSLAGSSAVQPAWKMAPTPYEKMNAIFNFVRNTISWDHIESKYALTNLKNVLEKKKGNSGEINLLLVNLLRGADIDVYPLLVSERSHGKVDTTYSFLDQFNKVVACVDLDGIKYILDATDQQTPVSMIPVDLLNTVGFLVDKKQSGFVKLVDPAKRKSFSVTVRSTIKSPEEIEGRASVALFDYARIGHAAKYRGDRSGYQKEFLSTAPDMQVDSFTVHNLDTDSAGLVHDIVLRQTLNKSGNYYFLNYNFFTGFDKNPFVSDYRFTNIDFGSKYSCVLNCVFTLPENLKVESLPKNLRMVIPGDQLVAIRDIKKSGNQLLINLRIDINSPEFSADSYNVIKEFFMKLSDMLNEPVLLVGS